MATYAEQINSAFKTALDNGFTPAQAYEKLKVALASNKTALSTLDSQYAILNNSQKAPPATTKASSVSSSPTYSASSPTYSMSPSSPPSASWSSDSPKMMYYSSVGNFSSTNKDDPRFQSLGGIGWSFDTSKKYTDEQIRQAALKIVWEGNPKAQAEFIQAYKANPNGTDDAYIFQMRKALESQGSTTTYSASVTPFTSTFNNPSSDNNPNATQQSPNSPGGTTTASFTVNSNWEKTYTYNWKQYTQAQMDEIAKKASPEQLNTLDKTFDTNYAKQFNLDNGGIDYSQIDSAGAEFKKWYDAYIQAQKDVYGISTDRQNQQFGYQREDLTTQNQRSQQDINTAREKGLQSYDWQAQDAQRSMERTRADYAKFTGQEVKDTARQLAINNTDFARSLTNATRAYWQRGILQAGVQKASLWEWVDQFSENQNYFKTLSQRRLDNAGTNMNQAEQDYTTQSGRLWVQKSQFETASNLQEQRLWQDYNTNTNRLATSQSQYAQDRAAGSQAMVAGLQQQGNTLYGQNQVNSVLLAQQQADQDAIDKLYGRTKTTRPNLLKNIY